MQRKRVLLVDDNPDVVALVTVALTYHDLEVEGLREPGQAIPRLQEGGFDLLMIDMMMPQMDGLTLCEAIRTVPGLDRLPIVVYSAQTPSKEERVRLRKAGCTFVSKQVPHSELALRVMDALQ